MSGELKRIIEAAMRSAERYPNQDPPQPTWNLPVAWPHWFVELRKNHSSWFPRGQQDRNCVVAYRDPSAGGLICNHANVIVGSESPSQTVMQAAGVDSAGHRASMQRIWLSYLVNDGFRIHVDTTSQNRAGRPIGVLLPCGPHEVQSLDEL